MNNIVQTTYYSFSDLTNIDKFDYQVCNGYLKLYNKAKEKSNPTILELGTNKGLSTLVFLQATAENGGRLYSVDIDSKFSDLTAAPEWTFIHSDSTDVAGILSKHPALKDGIDILLIDSLHKKFHVEKELSGWWPYLNKDAIIIFDDVDSHIYRKNSRKDNIHFEFDWTEIREFVEELFYANEDKLLLELHLGSTGYAIMTKRAERIGTLRREAISIRRTKSLFWINYIRLHNNFASFKRLIRGR
jgi:hypothetical protein